MYLDVFFTKKDRLLVNRTLLSGETQTVLETEFCMYSSKIEDSGYKLGFVVEHGSQNASKFII